MWRSVPATPIRCMVCGCVTPGGPPPWGRQAAIRSHGTTGGCDAVVAGMLFGVRMGGPRAARPPIRDRCCLNTTIGAHRRCLRTTMRARRLTACFSVPRKDHTMWMPAILEVRRPGERPPDGGGP